MTIDEILDEFFTIYIAGMDTTGHLTGMIIYYVT
jgi:cytochrome P450